MEQYNLKIKDYPDSLQVSYYETKIKRGEKESEDSTRTNKDYKQPVNDSVPNTWHNPETNQLEVIPEGFHVVEHPFEKRLMLFPDDMYLDKDVWISMEYENLLSIVQEKLKEERSKKDFSNTMRSLRRTKQNVYEIARGSVWELFVTLTIADESIRNDLDAVKKRVSKVINNMRNKKGLDVKYLLIAERHPTSGAWHLHGLFKDIGGLRLERAVNPHTGQKIVKNGVQVYNLPDFDILGFTTATYVQNNAKVTKYVLKYITKDMVQEFPGKRNYLCSQKLPRGTEVIFDVESEEAINDKLLEFYGYIPELTFGKKTLNPYLSGEVTYLQYKK